MVLTQDEIPEEGVRIIKKMGYYSDLESYMSRYLKAGIKLPFVL